MYYRLLFWGMLCFPGVSSLYTYLRFLESHHLKYLEQGLYLFILSLLWLAVGARWARQQSPDWSPQRLQGVVAILLSNVLVWVAISPFVNRTLNQEHVTIVNESPVSIDRIEIQTEGDKQVIEQLSGFESVQVTLSPKDLNKSALRVYLQEDEHRDSLFVHHRSLGFRQGSILAIQQDLTWVNHQKRVLADRLDARQTKIRYQQWSAETYQASEEWSQYQQQLSFFPVSGGLMAYLDVGAPKAPPILLIHDGLRHGFLFRHVVADLAEAGFRVIVPDLMGSGASDSQGEMDQVAPTQQARYLAELMQGLYLHQWTEVVYGSADLILFEQLEQYPDKISRLALIESPAALSVAQQAIAVRPIQALRTKIWMGLEYESWVSNWWQRQTLSKQAGQDLGKEIAAAYSSPLQDRHTTTAWYWHTNIEEHLAQGPRHHQICIENPKPALLVRSMLPTPDGQTAEQQTEALIQQLGWSQPRVEYLESCGKLSPETCPDILAQKLCSFLRKTS